MDRPRLDPVTCLVGVGIVGPLAIVSGHPIVVALIVLAISLLAMPLSVFGMPKIERSSTWVGVAGGTLVLLVLAPLVLLPMLNASCGHGNIGATRSFIRNIQQALAEYESDWGNYPPSDAACSSRPLVTYLDGDPSNGGPQKMYMEFKADLVLRGEPTDPWGRPYHYRENRLRLRQAGVESAPPRAFDDDGVLNPWLTDGVAWQSFDVWPDELPKGRGWTGSWQ